MTSLCGTVFLMDDQAKFTRDEAKKIKKKRAHVLMSSWLSLAVVIKEFPLQARSSWQALQFADLGREPKNRPGGSAW